VSTDTVTVKMNGSDIELEVPTKREVLAFLWKALRTEGMPADIGERTAGLLLTWCES
jgi:hypothetical protein